MTWGNAAVAARSDALRVLHITPNFTPYQESWSPGEKNGRKRMAELACVYDAAPAPRTAEDIISTPAQKRRKKAQASKSKGEGKPREPQAKGKWLTASVTDDIPAVIAAAFDEAERRDPGRKREWAVLVDGNKTQIEAVTAEAARRGITVTITIDFIHVLPVEGRMVLLRQGRARRRGMGR